MNIVVVGIGYVGLANAVLLAQKNHVFAVDIRQAPVDALCSRRSPVADPDIERYLLTKPLDLTATVDGSEAYPSADFVIIATPTNYNPQKNYFDTSSVEAVIQQVKSVNSQAVIIIKSTVPVGYTREIYQKYGGGILFSPEFLQEGQALYGSLHPSRIIIGIPPDDPKMEQSARQFASALVQCAAESEIPLLFMEFDEAEAVKLFANSYLALRIAFFNELDTYAELRGLSSDDIIRGVCLDPRIGDHYNNPSFGYGGYCLPKDTKQLKANFSGVPNCIISAVVEANRTRKNFIAQQIIARAPSLVGIYRLTMKTNSDNFRESSVLDIMQYLMDSGIQMIVYEPFWKAKYFMGCEVIRNLQIFKERSDLIVANRLCAELNDVINKVYTRDLYKRD